MKILTLIFLFFLFASSLKAQKFPKANSEYIINMSFSDEFDWSYIKDGEIIKYFYENADIKYYFVNSYECFFHGYSAEISLEVTTKHYWIIKDKESLCFIQINKGIATSEENCWKANGNLSFSNYNGLANMELIKVHKGAMKNKDKKD